MLLRYGTAVLVDLLLPSSLSMVDRNPLLLYLLLLLLL
jgi:hypothetical protein